MDFTGMSYLEVNKLYIQAGFELVKRSWWLVVVFLIILWVISKVINK